MTNPQNVVALTYWDNVLQDAYEARTDRLLKKRDTLRAAGFTETERTSMLMRGWGGQTSDPDLTDERAAAMAAILVGGEAGLVSN